MQNLTLRLTEQDDLDLMLAGWIFAAADLRRPVVAHSVVLKPTLESRLDFPPGVYFYRFNASAGGKFKLAAAGAGIPDQSRSFDTKEDGQFHLSFRFEVSA